MDRNALIEELKVVIQDYLKNKNLDLVDLICRYEGRDLVLRVLADKPQGGITLGECAYLNIEISRILDEKDIPEARYILEVSSPGLDRPRETNPEFLRCVNKAVKVFLNEPMDGKLEWDGLINKVEDDSVYIDTPSQRFVIPISKINKAKQIICII